MENAFRAVSHILQESGTNDSSAGSGILPPKNGSPLNPGEAPTFADLLKQITSPQMYLKALDDLGIGIAITEGNRFIQVSSALCAMYGYTEDELLQMPSYLQLIPEEEHPRLLQKASDRIAQKTYLTDGETTIIRRDGKRIRIEYLIREFEENGAQRTYAFMRDMTQRKEAETKSKLLASAVESTSEIITITDSQNRLFFVNKTFLETYGYSEQEILGKSPGLLSPGDDGDSIADEIWHKTQAGRWSGKLLNKRKDGKIFPIQLSTSPILDDDGHVLGYIGIGRDITDLNEAEHALLEADERFHALFSDETLNPLDTKKPCPPLTCTTPKVMHTLADHIHATLDAVEARIHHVLSFSSFASHELRTPLTIMRSSLESAMDKDTPVGEIRQALSQVYDEVLHLDHMVGMLLEVGRMQTGSLKLTFQSINLADFIDEFYQDARLLCEQKGVEFTLGSAPVVYIKTDPKYLRQCFFNLLDNACKHTASGGRMDLGYAISGKQVVVQFSDSGSGILPTDLRNVFEPFFKGSEGASRNVSGAGLGLALVKWVVEAHGGTVAVKSQVGVGTTFEIRLPAYQA